MYLYEKKLGKIEIFSLEPNMKEIIKAKEYEVYSKLDYLTTLKAETCLDEEILLNESDLVFTESDINYKVGDGITFEYHTLEEDKSITEEKAFSNLDRIIKEPILKTVNYIDEEDKYLALLDPKYYLQCYFGIYNIKEMSDIVPISERIYYINELMKLFQNGNVEELAEKLPIEFFNENQGLFLLEKIFTPSIWYHKIDDLYKYGIVSGNLDELDKKIIASEKILQRIRTK